MMVKKDPMNSPDYKDMRSVMLSKLEAACRQCRDRYVDASGKEQCRRDDCPAHSVRAQAMAMSPTAFQS
ncbi:MAG: hypothetical protein JKY27_06660 [Magnetovibrio sp.]|nr:hypothetical protein [Magnetovibrio sp.]